MASAGSKSQQHLFAISQRQSLSEAVTDILVERGDRDVVHAVVKNTRRAVLRRRLPHAWSTRSTGDDALAPEVGMRSDIPRPHFLMLLEKASSAVRGAPRRRESAGRRRHRRRRGRGRRRHPQRNPQRVAGFCRGAGGRWSGRTASAASAKPKSTNMPATASSRKPRSRCRSCATRRSTWSSARCSIPAPRSSLILAKVAGLSLDHDEGDPVAARRPTAACRPRISSRRWRASTGCSPTPPGACSASSARAPKNPREPMVPPAVAVNG